jgi:hypothetical protein
MILFHDRGSVKIYKPPDFTAPIAIGAKTACAQAVDDTPSPRHRGGGFHMVVRRLLGPHQAASIPARGFRVRIRTVQVVSCKLLTHFGLTHDRRHSAHHHGGFSRSIWTRQVSTRDHPPTLASPSTVNTRATSRLEAAVCVRDWSDPDTVFFRSLSQTKDEASWALACCAAAPPNFFLEPVTNRQARGLAR